MKLDPYTIRVALDKSGNAKGELYIDDGDSYDYREGSFVWRSFVATTEKKKTVKISSSDLGAEKPNEAVDGGVALAKYDGKGNKFARSIKDVRVEKVVVVGLNGKPSSVKLEDGTELAWVFDAGIGAGDKKEGTLASVLSIKDPRVPIVENWSIVIQL
jgi:mannosyl-oligosaccharide alpha-1,3-glucosidase